MKRAILSIFLVLACFLGFALLPGCATQDPSAFVGRSRTELSSMTAAMQSAVVMLQVGTIDKAKAANIADESLKALTIWKLARSLEAPGPNAELDALLKSAEDALAVLQVAAK